LEDASMRFLRGFVVGGLFCALLLALPPGAKAAEVPEAARRQEIETVLREYLRAHPEVVAEALQEMERREQEAQRKRAAEGVRAHLAELTQDSGNPVGGNPQGTVTIVEFFDYQCGYCKKEAVELTKLLQADPDIRMVYKDLPILGPVSLFASRAALAAQKQGKHGPFHDALMAATGNLTEQRVLQLAARVGLDAARLEKDMADPAVEEILARNTHLMEALGIRGTPALVIGTELVPGAADLDALKRLVAQARKK
jgi:protein-disulfide isomerase